MDLTSQENHYPYTSWIEIDLNQIEENTRKIAEWVNTPLMAVVKDDGYGHGAIKVAEAFIKGGGHWLGVARGHEGVDLREGGIKAPILVMGGILEEEAETAIENDLTLALHNYEMIDVLEKRAEAAGKTVNVHLKADTGMGRFGLLPEEMLAFSRRVRDCKWIQIDGLFSHFSSAGDDEDLSNKQLKLFREIVAVLEEDGLAPKWKHISNSSAILANANARFDLVRVGGILYGLQFGGGKSALLKKLKHAFSWKARLMSVKQMPKGWPVSYDAQYKCKQGEIIGVIPIGHGDGYERVPGNQVLIGGKRVPVVGTICMDQIMVSLPEKNLVGSEVVVVGSQGGQKITPEELRNRWKSTYSGVFLVHPRIPRIYK
ncbi:MAG: alanine racemase [Anaerolineaceae bacterium]|nr:alanine racemase [Anaerolineaceae bacterium]